MEPKPRPHFTSASSLAASGLGPLRHSFARWLRAYVPEAAVRADLVLAASELSATALRVAHSSPEPSQVSMRAWIEGSAVVMEIHDSIDGMVDASMLRLDGDADRGLAVAASVADVLTVRRAENTLLLRARKERATSRRLLPVGSG